MAKAGPLYLIVGLFIIISPSHCTSKHIFCDSVRMSLPTTITSSDYAFDEVSNFMLTRLFGLPLNETRFFILPLMACHIMRLLQGMILRPSGNIVQFKKKPYGSLLPFCRALIILLLILSGNVHVHPGPAVTVNPISAAVPGPDANPCLEGISFTNFCSHKALGFLHINSRSLLSKIDRLKVWTHSSNPDILVVTESWLKNLCLTLLLISLAIMHFVKTGPLNNTIQYQYHTNT